MPQTGQRLRELRLARRLTQEKLAQKADLTVYTVCRIENGHHEPNAKTTRKLARALEVTPAALIPDTAPDTDSDHSAA